MESVGIVFTAVALVCAILMLAFWSQDKYQEQSQPKARLRKAVKRHHYIDVGRGAAEHFGVTPVRLQRIVNELVDEGYQTYYLRLMQNGSGQEVIVKVLCAPDTSFSSVYKNRDQIRSIN